MNPAHQIGDRPDFSKKNQGTQLPNLHQNKTCKRFLQPKFIDLWFFSLAFQKLLLSISVLRMGRASPTVCHATHAACAVGLERESTVSTLVSTSPPSRIVKGGLDQVAAKQTNQEI